MDLNLASTMLKKPESTGSGYPDTYMSDPSQLTPKKVGFTAPDGTFYRWNKPTPPTQDDINAIVAFHNNRLAEKKKKAEANTYSGYPDTYMNPRDLNGRPKTMWENLNDQLEQAVEQGQKQQRDEAIKAQKKREAKRFGPNLELNAYMQSLGATPEEAQKRIAKSNAEADWKAPIAEGIRQRSKTIRSLSPTGNINEAVKKLTVNQLQEDLGDYSKWVSDEIKPVTSVADFVYTHLPTTMINNYLAKSVSNAARPMQQSVHDWAASHGIPVPSVPTEQQVDESLNSPIHNLVHSTLTLPADIGTDLAILGFSSDATPGQRLGALANVIGKTVAPEIVAEGFPAIRAFLKSDRTIQGTKIYRALEDTLKSGIREDEIISSLRNSPHLGEFDGKPNYTPKSLTGRPSIPEIQGRLEAETQRIAQRNAAEAGVTDVGSMTKNEFQTQNWRKVTQAGIDEADGILKTIGKKHPAYQSIKNVRGQLVNSLKTGERLPDIMDRVGQIYDDLTAQSKPLGVNVNFEPNQPVGIRKYGGVHGAAQKLADLQTQLINIEKNSVKTPMTIEDFAPNRMAAGSNTFVELPDGSVYAPKGEIYVAPVEDVIKTQRELLDKLNKGEEIPVRNGNGDIDTFKYNPHLPETTKNLDRIRSEIKSINKDITDFGKSETRTRLSETPGETNAIQKPPTNESMLRQEGSQMGLRPMAEGNTTRESGPTFNQEGKASKKSKNEIDAYEGLVASSNDASNALRHEIGLGPVEETPARTRALPSAPYEQTLKKARSIVDKVSRRLKIATPSEAEVLQFRDAEIHYKNEYNRLTQEINDNLDAGKDVTDLTEYRDEVRKNIDHLTQANKYMGTEQSRAFSARNRAKFEDYTPAGLYSDWQASAGRKLTPEEAKLADTIGKEASDYESKIIQKQKEVLKEQAEDLLPKKRNQTIEEIQKRRGTSLENISKKWTEGGNNVIMNDPFLVQSAAELAKRLGKIAPDVLELIRTFVDEGATRLEDVVGKVRETLAKKNILLSDDDIHRIIAGEYEKKKVTLSDTAETMKDIRKEASTTKAVQESRLIKKINKLQESIETGKFTSRPRTEAAKELESLQIKYLSKKAQADEIRAGLNSERQLKDMAGFAKGWKTFTDLSRTLKASFDLSAMLNQGAFLLPGRPIRSAGAFVDMIKALRSPEAARDLMSKIKLNPYYDKAVAAGLDLKMGSEFFTSKLLDNLPGFSHSERAYNAYLHKLRMDVFADIVKSQERPWFKRFGMDKELTLEELRQTAEYVNTVTGIGTGKFAGALKNLNEKSGIFFAPGYKVSRYKTAFGSPLWNSIIKGNPKLALQIFKDYTATAATIYGTLAIAKSFGYEVELDPRSSSFGKIRQGDVEVDPFGGLLKPLRTVIQIAMGRKSSIGAVSKYPAGVYGTELESMLSPALGAIIKPTVSTISGTEFYNDSYDLKTAEGWKNFALDWLPMNIKSQKEISDSKTRLTPEQQALLRIGAVFGANVNVKDKKENPR
jgi:hypothetical protein